MSKKRIDYSQYYSNRDVISFFSGAMGLDIGLEKAVKEFMVWIV